MWIFALGETVKRVALTSHFATSRLSADLCQVLTDMTRLQAPSRASLMHLLDVISGYCTKRQQNRPFSHIVMDLHREAMAALEIAMDTPWGPPAMPELRPRTKNRSESTADGYGTIPRRWLGMTRNNHDSGFPPRLTKEASTSMEDLSARANLSRAPGNVVRPKSMCVPEGGRYFEEANGLCAGDRIYSEIGLNCDSDDEFSKKNSCGARENGVGCRGERNGISNDLVNNRRLRVRKNPVQRAASRLYRVGSELPPGRSNRTQTTREVIGPEFVVRASLPNKQLIMTDQKGSSRKTVTVLLLNGQKLDVLCNPNSTTAGQLFELIIQKEHIEENFMLGLSALIAGDFVFLPSDTRICKVFHPDNNNGTSLTLFMRVRFFLSSLRGIRGSQARHLLYLQLRRSILEHQLPCSFRQIIELNGLALQAEFGDFNQREHGTRDYFLLEHYVPETMSCIIEDSDRLRQELIKGHVAKSGLDPEKAEQDFIIFAQTLPHYGGHFYTATWMLKDNNHKDIWLYISAQGINLYERGQRTSNFGPEMYESFEWRNIQTLCYSKQYLCILPHSSFPSSAKLKKYKLKMDQKKSYFTFRLASLHHQFFLRLRTEYISPQTLSQQFGIPLKDIKNETNSLYKLEALTNANYASSNGTVNAETEFKIEFRTSSRLSSKPTTDNVVKRSKSVNDFNGLEETINEDFQNKENENPSQRPKRGLVLESKYLSGLPAEKRRGVKMGMRAFVNMKSGVSRSMEAMYAASNEYLEQMSLQSVSLHCSSTSMSRSPTGKCTPNEAYVLDSTIKQTSQPLLPDFQETLSESLLEKLNSLSFAEERILSAVTVERDLQGSLGLQITEGSDGNVYVQSVIPGGQAYLKGSIQRGDQVVAVDGTTLLGMKYKQALNFLKSRGSRVEFVLARTVAKRGDMDFLGCNYKGEGSRRKERESPVEKHLTESCRDISNLHKYSHSEVPYHKHIRYEIEPESEVMFKKPLTPAHSKHSDSLRRAVSKSCSHLYSHERDKAVVVELIPKENVDLSNVHSLDRKHLKGFKESLDTVLPIAVPRSLGLSRKWRGPVRYPVTPVKKTADSDDVNYVSTSDEEQVFI
nr:tyrosine-protein phosphatase non-receptor type 13-like [Leptinotarsa decemlineata]